MISAWRHGSSLLHFQAAFTTTYRTTNMQLSFAFTTLLASASAIGLPGHSGALYSQCDMDSPCDSPYFCDAQLHICPPYRYSTAETISRVINDAQSNGAVTKRSLSGSVQRVLHYNPEYAASHGGARVLHYNPEYAASHGGARVLHYNNGAPLGALVRAQR
jgi:hypothetical protein